MKPLLTVKDLARLLNVNQYTIYHWIPEGKIPPPIRIGKKIRFKEEDIEKWLEEKKPLGTIRKI